MSHHATSQVRQVRPDLQLFSRRPDIMPKHGICDGFNLASVVMDLPTDRMAVSVSRAVDRDLDPVYALTMADDESSFYLSPEGVEALLVELAKAYAAICLDRAQWAGAQPEAFGDAGAVADIDGHAFRIGSQLFPFPGAATEHNVLFNDVDTAFGVAEVPELVRLLLVASREACVPSGPEGATAA